MINGNFFYLVYYLFCRRNDIQYYYIYCQDFGGKKEYLYIELWLDVGGKRKRWVGSQIGQNREEFEIFIICGLIIRINYVNLNGYLEIGEVFKMFCGKYYIFFNV